MGVILTECMDVTGSFIYVENSRRSKQISENQHEWESTCQSSMFRLMIKIIFSNHPPFSIKYQRSLKIYTLSKKNVKQVSL